MLKTNGDQMDLTKFKPLFPMVYLLIAGWLAVACKKLGVDDTTTGMLVGAALTRVKMPAPPPKEN